MDDGDPSSPVPASTEHNQSHWNGTPENWRAAREVILDGVTGDGDFLDVGCGDGRLLESLIQWGVGRGITLVPHGIDPNPDLIDQARARFQGRAEDFTGVDFSFWKPDRRHMHVHTPIDHIPTQEQAAWLQHLLDEVVAPGGRLLVSSYGDQASGRRPLDIDLHLQMLGFRTAGCSNGMQDDRWVATRTAWIDV